jgi:hypothetical protein
MTLPGRTISILPSAREGRGVVADPGDAVGVVSATSANRRIALDTTGAWSRRR